MARNAGSRCSRWERQMNGDRDPWWLQRWAYGLKVGNPVRKSVLMALAVHASVSTGRCEVKHREVALWTEAGTATVAKHLKGLEEMGLIARRAQFRHDRGRRADEYLLLAPGIFEWPDGQPVPGLDPPVDASGGDPASPGEGQGSLAGGSETTNGTAPPSAGISARDRRMKHRGRDVPQAVVRSAVDALEHFGAVTKQSLAPLDGTGAPSESLKRIVGAMLAHPCVVDEWRAMIDASVADPWWRDEDPGVGVVFGPKVVEQSIGKGRRPVKAGRSKANGRSTPWSAQDMLALGEELDSQ
jgi:hypothetical protein